MRILLKQNRNYPPHKAMAQLSASLEAPGHVLPGEPTLWSCCDSRPATFVWSPSFHPAAFRHLPMRPPRRQLDLVEPPPLAQSWPTALDFFQSPTFLRSSNPPGPSGSTLLLSIHPPSWVISHVPIENHPTIRYMVFFMATFSGDVQ